MINDSVGGDTTSKVLARLHRDVIAHKPHVVEIGLSLVNEGIRSSHPTQVYQQYVKNLKKIIQILQHHDIIPVVANCVPHSAFTAQQLSFIREFVEKHQSQHNRHSNPHTQLPS